MKRILVPAKDLRVGDYVVTQPVDKDQNPIGDEEYIEVILAIGVNLSDRTVDIRTKVGEQIRSAKGMPMDMELAIYRAHGGKKK